MKIRNIGTPFLALVFTTVVYHSNLGVFGLGKDVSHLEDLSLTNNILITKPKTKQVMAASSSAINCFGLGEGIDETFKVLFQDNPESLLPLKAKFSITTRYNTLRRWVNADNIESIEKTNFDIRRVTVIIVHGYLSSSVSEWIHKMEEAFLQWGNVNVIIVDWSGIGQNLNYVKAAENTEVVGDQLTRFLEELTMYSQNYAGIDEKHWGAIHCVGHSLGSHVCGIASYKMSEHNFDWGFARITGLDPAYPCFLYTDNSLRLDSSDASFVDVIHTNIPLLFQFGLGIPNAIGDMDFYPNGGHQQPGCYDPSTLIDDLTCSHRMAYEYFTESLISAMTENCTFGSRAWDGSYASSKSILLNKVCTPNVNNDCVEMGINSINYNRKGTFLTATANSFPYCLTEEKDRQHVLEVMKKNYNY